MEQRRLEEEAQHPEGEAPQPAARTVPIKIDELESAFDHLGFADSDLCDEPVFIFLNLTTGELVWVESGRERKRSGRTCARCESRPQNENFWQSREKVPGRRATPHTDRTRSSARRAFETTGGNVRGGHPPTIEEPSHCPELNDARQHTALTPAAGHSGFEGKLAEQVSFGSYFHYLHHRHFDCNYGESTLPLDKWFGSFEDGSRTDSVSGK